jgi:hypothetical protein
MEAVQFFEISVNFYQATRRDILEDCTQFSLCKVIRMWIPMNILQYLKAFCFPLAGNLYLRLPSLAYEGVYIWFQGVLLVKLLVTQQAKKPLVFYGAEISFAVFTGTFHGSASPYPQIPF